MYLRGIVKVEKYYMSDFKTQSHLPVESQWRYKASHLMFLPYLTARGVDVHGLENLPGHETPYVLAIKHHSNLDVGVAGSVLYEHDGTQVHFVSKRQTVDLPILGPWLLKAGAIRYDRDKPMSDQPEVEAEMAAVGDNNGVLGMFVERKRVPSPHLLILRKGLGMFAVGHGLPVATMGMYGTDRLWGRIQVVMGETIYPGNSDDDSERRRLMLAMEREYTRSLQAATYAAYDYAGVDYTSFPPPKPKNNKNL
jgi:1-acyl-sn-glycerol-3-phosphate acyltransferase